jgi:molybdopterin converting factor small subunit
MSAVPEDMVEVTARFGSNLRSGTPGRINVNLAAPATVGELRTRLGELEPGLAGALGSAIAVIDGQHCAPDRALEGGELVAFLLPVAGG